jgi:hypothetical protein
MATEIKTRKFLAKDFESFRNILLEYARTYYGDKISDFSESSVGGLFLDLSSYVGDVLSFYLDHQFNELNIDTAIESENIQKILKSNNVRISGATPSIVDCKFSLRIPAKSENNQIVPDSNMFPVIKTGTIVSTNNTIGFRLQHDLDFSSSTGVTVLPGKIVNQVPIDFIVSMIGKCISGQLRTDTFQIGEFQQFRKLTLTNSNVTQIFSVIDSNGNDYYEVNSLTDDVVYKNSKNLDDNTGLVKEVIEVVPAPYRFTTEVDINTKRTSLIFGGGSALNFEDDIIPDPSEYAISFNNTTTFSKIYINPNNLINSKTLGIADSNVELKISYSFGGGLSHNVPKNSIVNIDILNIFFPNNISQNSSNNIRSSIQVINDLPAKGGEEAPTLNDLRNLVPRMMNSQNRIVTKEDLLARIYTMPSNFGRVFRAGISKNQIETNVLKVFVVSRQSDGRLSQTPTDLKTNIKKFLEPYRLISDMIELSDAIIINLKVTFNIRVDPKFNQELIKQLCIQEIISYFDVKKTAINKPINLDEIRNLIFTIRGVASVTDILIENLNGISGGRSYSSFAFQPIIFGNMIHPPDGGIFEIKFVSHDIVGIAT